MTLVTFVIDLAKTNVRRSFTGNLPFTLAVDEVLFFNSRSIKFAGGFKVLNVKKALRVDSGGESTLRLEAELHMINIGRKMSREKAADILEHIARVMIWLGWEEEAASRK